MKIGLRLGLGFGSILILTVVLDALSKEAGNALLKIVNSVNSLQSMVQQIASATEEMSTVSEQISSDIDVVANVSKETASASGQIAQASQDLAGLSTELKGIVSQFRLDESLPAIVGIYSDFSQSFSNLIKNAMDAMRNTEKKKLIVKTCLKDNYIHVEIADSGIGIPEKNLDHIFKPYFTTKPLRDEAREGEPVGTGLGLYMVRKLLEKYNAEYDIKSRLGEGTTFTIKLPYKLISNRG